MMNKLNYVFGIILGIIIAPIVGFIVAVCTFFVTAKAVVDGCHVGLMNNIYGKKQDEPEDIWERHENRRNLNTKKEKE